MQPTTCLVRPVRGSWLGGIATVLLVGSTTLAALAASQGGSTPRFTYGSGARGVGYQATRSMPSQAARPAAASARPATVGPGARNWATGNRVPLHRPWLSSR